MNDKAVAGVVGALALIIAVGLGVMLHLHLSLVDATNQLVTCVADGMSQCHIERDGLQYNVYGLSNTTDDIIINSSDES